MKQKVKGQFIKGNLNQKAAFKSWFIGFFVKPKSHWFHNQNFEVKWGKHKKGDKGKGWVANKTAFSLAILIKGKVRMQFEGGKEVVLKNQGDYVGWAPGVYHDWEVLEDSVIITIRWPSLANDQVVKS